MMQQWCREQSKDSSPDDDSSLAPALEVSQDREAPRPNPSFKITKVVQQLLLLGLQEPNLQPPLPPTLVVVHQEQLHAELQRKRFSTILSRNFYIEEVTRAGLRQ
ncbi:unnamed protein product, partial [Amoebophrya sp. A25]|eukprot:GSA25T00026151001.1